MKYWIGSLLGAYGLYLLVAAQAHRTRIVEARSEAIRLNRVQPKPIDPHSVAALGEMVAPIVMIALAWLTLKLCFAYYWLNTNGTLSPLDLAGTIVLIVGYATWLHVKTKYRMPDLAPRREMDVTRPRPEVTQKRASQQPSFALELTP
jgi:hypothetical protein